MKAGRTILTPDGLGAPIGLYSHVVSLPEPSQIVAIAGQLAVDEDGAVVGGGSLEDQARQAFVNLGHALTSANMTFADVLKFTTYLTRADLIEPFYTVREEIFADLYPQRNYPGNTLLVVSRLVREEFLIEIEALAGR